MPSNAYVESAIRFSQLTFGGTYFFLPAFQKSYNILPTRQQKKQHRTVKTCMEAERRQETIQYSMESPQKIQALQQRN